MSRPSDGDLSIDTVLRNTYKVISVLGRGGMGSVYLAQHLRLPGKQVAVKVLRGGDHLTPEIFARFRREAEIASRLGHPNIVEVLDYDTFDDDTPFLVLEFLRGESLQSRLERGRLPLSDVYSFTRQMGSALQAAHGAGIVHRDLKPANVFLVPTDSGGVVGERLKLLDFGISKVLDSGTVQTQEAMLIGTPQYMSPEQAQGRNSEIDARTDIFALGAIVYEMMTGTPAFGAGGIAQMIFRVVYEPPPPLAPLCPEAPPHAIAAVDKALAKRAGDRFQDVASFVEALTGSPLHTLSSATGSHAALPRPSGAPSGVALPSAGPPSLSNTLPPGSLQKGPDTGRLAFDDTLAPGSSGNQGAVQPVRGFASGGTGQMGVAQASSPAANFASGGTGQMGVAQASAPAAGFAAGGTGQMGVAQAQAAGPQVPLMDPPGLDPTLISQQAPSLPPPVAGQSLVAPVPMVPAVAPSTASPPPKSRAPLAAIAVAALVVVIAGGWWVTRPKEGTGPQPTPPVATGTQGALPTANTGAQGTTAPPANTGTQGTTPMPPANTGTVAQGTDTPTGTTGTTPTPVDPPPDDPTGVANKNPPPSTRPSNRPETPEKLSAELRQLLADAERALNGGDTAEAIRLARSSQRREPKVIPLASYSLLTRAFCRQGDLSNAKAQWPKVSRAEQARVRKFCMQHDIEL
ncbi:protein kinase [Myxococcus sp. K38C18041901]|uniref:serine/threonine-protein kinase n=1 Tax=Myxococcus guangdongensis TaxID=2906760 RepID=UPI0020A7C8BB|nr:protein kinase [Myxococcus guangdongensis]MCP3063876.1 protein kinase [Myxococcus guangdongensis]